MNKYTIAVRSTGSWAFEVNGLDDDELDGAITRIEYAKKRGRKAYWQITTRAGQTTRIYGDQIAGFNWEKES